MIYTHFYLLIIYLAMYVYSIITLINLIMDKDESTLFSKNCLISFVSFIVPPGIKGCGFVDENCVLLANIAKINCIYTNNIIYHLQTLYIEIH